MRYNDNSSFLFIIAITVISFFSCSTCTSCNSTQHIVALAHCLNLIQTIATGQSFIDPTGTYKLDSKTKTKNGDTYGYFGEIRVKLLDSNKVAMSFYICKGAPAYNSGSFVDTLPFYNNTAIYKDKYDTAKSCMVKFEFSKIKIKLQETANYKYGTCWGQGVVASGSYKKLTSDIPIIKDPLVDD